MIVQNRATDFHTAALAGHGWQVVSIQPTRAWIVWDAVIDPITPCDVVAHAVLAPADGELLDEQPSWWLTTQLTSAEGGSRWCEDERVYFSADAAIAAAEKKLGGEME